MLLLQWEANVLSNPYNWRLSGLDQLHTCYAWRNANSCRFGDVSEP